ncbi:hypothetical protein A5664_02545 [Mycolicibacterium fortuitum]|uniref:hypothetical protein n=1 Tax=Mycolicibacterium fortuitum TaxID=1766 RepID=UPI0007EC5451|nr:hypothetical protein [Mycolicibacterium fortuitum]OBI77120.1 hypothetical protein A5664_02545 [Mycolicibacterium fortuitum]
MSAALFGEDAHRIYMNLDAECAAVYPKRLDANYVADEIQRIVQQISSNPDQAWLQRHRVIGMTLDSMKFVVVIQTATGVEFDAAVVWMFRPSDDRPVILAIDLQYLR